MVRPKLIQDSCIYMREWMSEPWIYFGKPGFFFLDRNYGQTLPIFFTPIMVTDDCNDCVD